ncbi:MAG: NFACT RNA binding domain-containing protein [Planctomycetota bacterium]
MPSSEDLRRWLLEAAPALGGGFVHRVWREGEAWVLLVRHHAEGDPERPVARRVALEVAVAADFARCVALPPEAVDADDGKRKKVWSKDAHPFLGLLRKHLVGARVSGLEQLPGDRVALLRCAHERTPDPGSGPGPGHDSAEGGPRKLLLAIELMGRAGNLVLCHEDDADATRPLVLGSLHAGRAARPFERGLGYEPPPLREPKEPPKPTLGTEVRPDPETLALGLHVAAVQREAEAGALADSRRADLERAARKAIERGEGVLAKLSKQLEEVAEADRLEAEGDLLKQHLGALKRGASQVTLTDYSTGEARELTLSLDPTLEPLENMQARYKRAKKLRRGEGNVLQRQGETDAQLAELRGLQARLAETEAGDEAALDELEAALRKLGALPKEKAPRQKQQENQGPRSFRTLEGHEVLVGRSDEENDRLTMRTARGNDLFFHVAGCPGSHVILRVDPKRPPNHESLVDAAALAVHYSKARQRGRVDVHYTPRKWVKKPRGAKPGLVQISNFKTVRAGGEPERLQRLFQTLGREEDDE